VQRLTAGGKLGVGMNRAAQQPPNLGAEFVAYGDHDDKS